MRPNNSPSNFFQFIDWSKEHSNARPNQKQLTNDFPSLAGNKWINQNKEEQFQSESKKNSSYFPPQNFLLNKHMLRAEKFFANNGFHIKRISILKRLLLLKLMITNPFRKFDYVPFSKMAEDLSEPMT